MKEKQKQRLEAGTGHPGALQLGCLWEQAWSSCRRDRGPRGRTGQLLRKQPLPHRRDNSCSETGQRGRGLPCELEVLMRVGVLICFTHSGIHRSFIALFFTCVRDCP